MKDIIVKIKHALDKKYVFDQPGEVTRDPLKDIKILLQEINTIQIREALVAKHRDEIQKLFDENCKHSDRQYKRIIELYEKILEWKCRMGSTDFYSSKDIVKEMTSLLEEIKK
jgi:ribosome-binding ATPase YchF (GTP1/OBG family)